MPRTAAHSLAWLASAVLLAACGSPSIPSTSPDTISTIVAATMAAHSVTPTAPAMPTGTAVAPQQIAETGIPPTVASSRPAATQPGATRIDFLDGATSVVVSDSVEAGQVRTYVLQASLAQVMMVQVDSPNQDVVLSLKTAGGTNMLSAAAAQTAWKGTLPQTEDYYLSVVGGQAPGAFTLTVTIPVRIKFLEGQISAKASGKTAGGLPVSYTVFAVKGQKLGVGLGGLSDTAALSVFGFTDGQRYLRAEKEETNFSFTLPKTQDYIIQVVPKGNSVISFGLGIQIE